MENNFSIENIESVKNEYIAIRKEWLNMVADFEGSVNKLQEQVEKKEVAERLPDTEKQFTELTNKMAELQNKLEKEGVDIEELNNL